MAAGLANFVNQPGFRGYAVNTQTPYSQQFNFTVQQQLSSSTTFTAAYVGALSRHLQSNPDGNIPDQVVPSGFNEQQFRPYPDFGGSSLIVYAGTANYNAAQVTVERQAVNGLSFLGAYTWSHALDDAFTLLGGTGQNGSGYRNQRLLGYRYDYGDSTIDVRQRFTFNTQYELPFGHGKRYLSTGGIANELAGGWATNLLFRVQTGQPVQIYANNNPAGTGNAYAYQNFNPFQVGGTPTSSNAVCATRTRTVATWFNPCAFSNPPQVIPAINSSTGLPNVPGAGQILSNDPNVLSSYGPRGRTTIPGPGYNRVDLSAFKSFAVYRETNVQFRADIFNLYNNPAYGQPGNTTGGGFGQITSERFGGSGTAGESPDSRTVQFALKYIF